MKYLLATILALVAFAGNSVLCRLALHEGAIDASSFTMIRLVSGAITLFVLFQLTQNKNKPSETIPRNSRKEWLSALMLFVYAICFSFAYISMDAGIGALVLFACVQITMIATTLLSNQKLSVAKWCGVLLAFVGLVYLVYAQGGLDDSNFTYTSFVLMAIAGIAWAAYTILGKGSANPLSMTYRNFSKSILFVLPVPLLFIWFNPVITTNGLFLALASGAITSALGYAIWYFALNGLNSIQAGVVQLSVPVITSVGGLIWLQEAFTLELIISQLMILGGIALVLFNPSLKRDSATS